MEQLREKIDLYGGIMETMGLSPLTAKIYIYLLLSPEPGATFHELLHYFKASKSAVSNALKLLQSTAMAESKTFNGQRKRYFYIDFKNSLNEEFIAQRFRIVSKLLEEIRVIRDLDDDFADELDRASLLYKMLLDELPVILNKWRMAINEPKD